MHPGLDAVFVCSRCGSFGCPGCVFGGREGEQVCRGCAALGLGEPIPWERRKQIGNWRAFIDTTRAVNRRTREFFRTPSIESSPVWAAVYGVAVYSFGIIVNAIILALAGSALLVTLAITQEEAAIGGVGAGSLLCVYLPLSIAEAPVNGTIGVIGAAGFCHLTLVLMKKNGAGFEHTLRAVSYSNAPYFYFFIPCIGPVLAWVWMVRNEIIAIRQIHGTSTDRAVIAVLGYRLVLLLIFVGIYAAMFATAYYAGPPGS